MRQRAVLAVLACFLAFSAQAATFTVNTTADQVDASIGNGVCATATGFCSLRAAIQEANVTAASDTINVPAGTYVVGIAGTGDNNCVTGDLDVRQDILIQGTDAALTIVDGNGLDRVFQITNNSLATLSGLMIRNGSVAGNGGGVLVDGSSSLVLASVTISNSAANSANGGGIFAGSGNISLTNVTLSTNSAADGAGLYVQSATVTLLNVTVTGNTIVGSPKAAGIRSGSGNFTVRNTIVAADNNGPECDGSIGPGSNNLSSDATCGFGTVAAPLLGVLANNGGQVFTHALLAGGPAIDTGTNTGCPATDARATPRPLDGDGNGSSICDMGAYEAGTGRRIRGNVYHDANNSGSLDGSELGIGTGYLKLISGGVVVAIATADPDDGSYVFPSVAGGSYTLIVDDNNSAADTTATAPTNWTFRTPATGSQPVTVGGSDVTGVNYGLTFNFDLAANCACGYQDGLFTQRTITIDGAMGDWAAVLSDADNNACDATDSSDRDHPVQSTGRNLLRAAVTFDASRFAMWTERVGSRRNTQTFIYYADQNNDGKEQTGEPVIVAGWQGNTGTVVLEKYSYNAVAGGGDPLTDGGGYVDGYNMPGTLTYVLTFPAANARGATAGVIAGTQMEWSVQWSDLGVAAGAAIKWHISSTNVSPGSGSLPSQIDDNMGGCGAQCLGANQFGGVTGNTITTLPGTIVYSSHVFTNTGNGNDRFDLTWTSAGPFVPLSVTFYRDLGTVGQYDPGVDVLVSDTDGDTVPDTGNLFAGQSFNLLVAIDSPAPPANGTTTVTIKATSNFFPGCGATVSPPEATVTDTIAIEKLQVVKRAYQADNTPLVDGVTLPKGTPVKFLLYVTNPGKAASDVAVSDALEAGFAYVAGTIRFTNAPAACAAPSCTGAEETAILAAANASPAGTDAVDGDVVSYGGNTIYAGNQVVGNAQLDPAAGKVWAVVFTVRMQ